MSTTAHVGYKADIIVDNVRISTLGIRVLRMPPLVVPHRRVTEIQIFGREDTLTETDGSYQPIDKQARLFYEGDEPLRAVQALRDAKRIEFSNEPGFAYDCRSDAAKELPRLLRMWHVFDWTWRCQPLKRQAVPEKYTGTTLSLVNIGNEPARPTIDITGTGDVTLTVGDQTVELTAIGAGKVTIDCELRLIHQNGLPIDHKMAGDFPVIPAGATVAVTTIGTITEMSVWPNWRWS